ncbi:MAG: glucose-6-phosphate dehydrogenase assembly protein OpcA [Candidatus Nanopelagicales bacterium]
MSLRLENTNAGAIADAISSERHQKGATASGMVMTLVIVSDEEHQNDATAAAQYSAGEHPMRILTVIPRPSREEHRLDANISVGDSTDGPGELVRMRLRGSLAKHADSVVLPLLLSDTPVVVWWPGTHPASLAAHPQGRLARRRIGDAAAEENFTAALTLLRDHLASGDTDLAWTRLTPWRAALAATLDQPYAPITGATIHSEPIPSAPLMRTWLEWRLGVPVKYLSSRGPAINQIVLHTEGGDITITRPDGHMATVERGGIAVKELFLPRRQVKELISEELRRLDPDEPFEDTMRQLDPQRLDPDDLSDGSTPSEMGEDYTRPSNEDVAILSQEGMGDSAVGDAKASAPVAKD